MMQRLSIVAVGFTLEIAEILVILLSAMYIFVHFMDRENTKVFIQAIARQVSSFFGNDEAASLKVWEAVSLLLGGDDCSDVFKTSNGNLFHDGCDLHKALANLNEKELRRKKEGVFYTLPDVTNFIAANAFVKYISQETGGVLSPGDAAALLAASSNKDKCKLLDASVFDPTCGAGEFLVSAIALKLGLFKGAMTDEKVMALARSICGNDIAPDSVAISKVRVFFSLVHYLSDINLFVPLATTINNNFSVVDFIEPDLSIFKTYDIIIGNPPYIEYRMIDYKPVEAYGNVYANVLSNSSKMIAADGVMGFVIPISYVATKRMSKIRDLVYGQFPNVCLLNYADRPDCLFAGVHQKLTILIASKMSAHNGTFSSSYNYWYKNERPMLFDNIQLSRVDVMDTCIPKLGNNMELSVFSKCLASAFENNLYGSATAVQSGERNSVYLNMRNCFWIKAFSFNPGSSEYKHFVYSRNVVDFVRCVLNSSLFFFFWVAVSDCWHITAKELLMFRLPRLDGVDTAIFTQLFMELEGRLEETKVYVGTKQTEYEYKHKLCKDIIDKIDDAIAPIYGLTNLETEYIKSYILKYRMSDAA